MGMSPHQADTEDDRCDFRIVEVVGVLLRGS